MKNLLNDLKKGLIIGFGIMIMVGMISGVYAGLASLKVTSGTTLTSQLWNDLVDHSVPSGFVGSFNLSACPTGWTVADGTNGTPDLRGAFVRGMNGNVNGRDVVRTLGEYQADDFMNHLHSVNPPSTNSSNQSDNHSHPIDPPNTPTTSDGIHSHGVTNGNTGFAAGSTTSGFQTAVMGWNHQGITIANSVAHTHYLDIASFTSGGNSTSHTHTTDIPAFNSANNGGDETRPKNVTLLYCVKN